MTMSINNLFSLKILLLITSISLITAAQLCSDACDYRQDGSCDDGGPNAEYKGCRLGSDCMDCGVRMLIYIARRQSFIDLEGLVHCINCNSK